MTTKQRVLNLARDLGVTVETGGGRHFEITADAPANHHFASGGEHALVEEADDGETQQAWRRMLERLECGIEPCDDSDACVEYAESDENVQVGRREQRC